MNPMFAALALPALRHSAPSNQSGKAIRFVAPEQISDTLSYERRIYETGVVATRQDNLHDALNALIWTIFPRAKAAINAQHYAEQTARRHNMNRGRAQDTLTLFDESGVMVASDDADLLRLLREMRWRELFWQRRAQVTSRMHFSLFGHGLCEKALQPFIGITGKALLLQVSADFFELASAGKLHELDGRAADWIGMRENLLTTRALCPLPILGIPGWWADNECESFYENTAYFRSRRQDRTQTA
jgi:hypothetical protein